MAVNAGVRLLTCVDQLVLLQTSSPSESYHSVCRNKVYHQCVFCDVSSDNHCERMIGLNQCMSVISDQCVLSGVASDY